MAEIKTREKSEKYVKVLDKEKVFREKTKKPDIKKSDKSSERAPHAPNEKTEKDSSVVAYADSKLKSGEKQTYRAGKKTVKTVADRSKKRWKESVIESEKHSPKTRAKTKTKTKTRSIKKANRQLKNTKRTTKTADKVAKQSAKAARRAKKKAQQIKQAAKAAAKAAREGAKRAVQATREAVRATILALKSLISLLAAGGWVVLLIIVVICLIAMIIASCFGIFFGIEDTGTGQTIRSAVQEINEDYMHNLDQIKIIFPHDEVEITGGRAAWREVLAVYSVLVTTDEENPQEVASMTDAKKAILSKIFWDMHSITHTSEVRVEKEYTETVNENGEVVTTESEVERLYLLIHISHKSPDEMAIAYEFTEEEKKQLAELLLPENQAKWDDVLYGLSGQGDMVAVALAQVGNVGGETYWRWYGFETRVDWCAIFVSWCANECGYLENGVLPSFAVCRVGEEWFRTHNQWKDNTYTPNPGDIIFFDWASDGGQDGIPNHVGIVEKVENGIVYSIEGNSDDACRQKSYPVGYYEIYGYGTLSS